MSSWTAEVREAAAFAQSDEELRAKLEEICVAYDNQPEPEYDYGVAWKAPRRKKWTYPGEGDYGDHEDAVKELKIMQRIPNTEARLVRRVREGAWEFLEEPPLPAVIPPTLPEE